VSESRPRQVSFAGGEFAPGLWGRTDYSKYMSGCRTALNFFVAPQGSLVSRPGTEHIRELVTTTQASSLGSGIAVPFIFSDTDALILVFIDDKLMFFKYDTTTGTVGIVEAYGNPIYVSTPYADSELPRLRFVQVGDTITITHPTYRTRELKRLTSDNISWSLLPLDFTTPSPPSWAGTAMVDDEDVNGPPNQQPGSEEIRWAITRVMKNSSGEVYETLAQDVTFIVDWDASLWSNYSGYLVGDDVWVAGYGDYWYRCILDHTASNPAWPPGNPLYWEERPKATFNARHFEYLHHKPQIVSSNNRVRIDWTVLDQDDNDAPEGADELITTRVYRGTEGRMGYVGETTGEVFEDDMAAGPDYTKVPPTGVDPWSDAAGGEFPNAVAMYEGRRYLATKARVNGSAVERLLQFELVTTPADDAPLEFELSTDRYEQIREIIPRSGLLVLTDSGEWMVSGSGDGTIITPNSIYAKSLSRWGCGTVRPVEANQALIFVQSKNTVPRAMVEEAGGHYRVVDMSVASRHLFAGYGILDWAFAEDPWNLLWVVRSDGTLLSCTFVPDEQMMAWTRHEIAGGTVEGVCSIPEGYEDAVYLLVRRSGRLHLERLTTRLTGNVEDVVCLDSSVTYNGKNEDTDSTVQVDNVGGETEINYPCAVTIVGEDTAGENVGKTLRVYGATAADDDDTDDVILVRLESHSGGGVYVGFLLSALPTDMDGAAFAVWSVTTEVVEGLEHLEGQEVYALVDGAVVGPLTVSGYQVTVATEYEPADVATVGLQYNCDFESLNLPDDGNRVKNTKAVTVEVQGSRPGYVGKDLDNLSEVKARSIGDGWGSIDLETSSLRALVRGRWEEHGRVAYRQVDPLPVTILGIMREVEVGG